MRPKNIVVLEDDALPLSGFFPATENLLSRRFELNTLYIKLHHPERLQRYWNPEPYHILEWMGLGLFGAMMHLLLSSHCTPLSFTFSPPHFLFLALYVMAVAELAERHFLLEILPLNVAPLLCSIQVTPPFKPLNTWTRLSALREMVTWCCTR